MNARRLGRVAAVSVAAAGLAVLGSAPSYAHGYTTAPTSRAEFCAQGVATDCGDIQWEPQSVEGPKGFPQAGPADGRICAGGNSRFSELDDPRGGAWPVNHLTSGARYTFQWHLTARHATSKWEYFITDPSWSPSQRVTRSSLHLFLTVPADGSQPPADVSQTGTLPAGRSGRAVILAVWTIADTGNAFYQCSDVDFG